MRDKLKNPSVSLLVAYALFKGPRDSKILRMVVDTGATTTVIPPKVAVAIGCDPARSRRRISIITAIGTEYMPVVTIPLIAGLGQNVQSLAVACHDLPPESTVDGLLGIDFLSHIQAFQQFHTAIFRLTQE